MLHVAANANFDPGERWEEVKDVTRKLFMLDLASSAMASIPHDLWCCPEVLYGTPIHIGNLYAGPKLTASIDNYLPPLTWHCDFSTGHQPVVFIVQRHETMELSGKEHSCETFIGMGSADGILYNHIPTDAVNRLRYKHALATLCLCSPLTQAEPSSAQTLLLMQVSSDLLGL